MGPARTYPPIRRWTRRGTSEAAAGGGSSVGGESATANNTPRRAARKPGGKRSWSPNKDINFFPDDQQSLVDFAEEKKPSNLGEKNVVISYYLTERLGMATFSIPDVLAGFKACGWKEAPDPNHSLRSLANRKSWVDTADTSAIKLHHLGRRYVEHELPKSSKK